MTKAVNHQETLLSTAQNPKNPDNPDNPKNPENNKNNENMLINVNVKNESIDTYSKNNTNTYLKKWNTRLMIK